jgi:hypothetical protein
MQRRLVLERRLPIRVGCGGEFEGGGLVRVHFA